MWPVFSKSSLMSSSLILHLVGSSGLSFTALRHMRVVDPLSSRSLCMPRSWIICANASSVVYCFISSVNIDVLIVNMLIK